MVSECWNTNSSHESTFQNAFLSSADSVREGLAAESEELAKQQSPLKQQKAKAQIVTIFPSFCIQISHLGRQINHRDTVEGCQKSYHTH